MNSVFIRNVHIERVRHLHAIDISLTGHGEGMRHLILTGKNGSGKTSVLNAMADYINLVYTIEWPPSCDHCGIDVEFNRGATEICEQYMAGDCVFAYFKAQRQFEAVVPNHIEKITFAARYAIDETPRSLFVKYLLDLKMTQALAASNGHRERANEIQLWFDRIRDILREIHEDPTLTLDFDEETYRFSIHEQGRQPFDFNEASDGFSAVLDIVVGLMLRMVRKNGRATTFDLPGIALIDEVENHLHLSLQRRVLPILTGLFPNMQFVVTTHSPFVLSSLGNAVVYDLESNACVRDGLAENTYESAVRKHLEEWPEMAPYVAPLQPQEGAAVCTAMES